MCLLIYNVFSCKFKKHKLIGKTIQNRNINDLLIFEYVMNKK